jgi:hypothetical protein
MVATPDLGSFWAYLAASSRVTSWRPRGSGIRIIERTFPTATANGASPSCRIGSGSLRATAVPRPFQGGGKARRQHRRCRHARLPMVDRDGFHTPSRSPRRVSISFQRRIPSAAWAAVICGTCTMVSWMRWVSIISPHGHLIRELGFCDGILSPASHIAYFRAVQSCSSRHA